MNPHSDIPWHAYSVHAIFETDSTHVWPLLADFNGLPKLVPQWIVSSSLTGTSAGVGAVRTLAFADGKTAQERLIALHPELFRLTYAMQDSSPFPWKHYFATHQLQVLGAGQTHYLVTGYYQPANGQDAEVKTLLQGLYPAFVEGISRVLNVRGTLQ